MSGDAPVYDWRDPAPYAAVLACGRSGLAWELLRRDPGYRAAMNGRAVSGCSDRPQIVQAAEPDFTARWGLHFRRESGSACVRRTVSLVGYARPLSIDGGCRRAVAV